eukprot:SAG31_NODE_3291_length_4457_cov_2.517439_3_plen_1058_part_00
MPPPFGTLLLALLTAGCRRCTFVRGDRGAPGPSRSVLVGTVPLGALVDRPSAILSQGTLDFAPIGSNATLGRGGAFTADVEGDYLVVGPGDQVRHHWRAVQLPPPPPTAAPDSPAPPSRRFHDGFHRSVVADGTAPLPTDSSLAGWERMAAIGASCVQNDGSQGLQLVTSACPGIKTSNDVVLPSMFTEPLSLLLSGLRYPPGKPVNLTIEFSELVVELMIKANGTAEATIRAATAQRIAAKTAADVSECGDRGIKLRLNANSANSSLGLACSGAGTAPLPLWNGFGTAHAANPADLRTNYTGGRSTLQLSGGPLSVRSVDLYSNLVPGNDPLRPTISVPALPAVLDGITDETGSLFPSSDLGLENRRAAEGILDVSAPPFSADPEGKRDSTQAIQAAVDWAREHYCVVFFPAGTYLVSESIVIRAVPRYMAQGHVPGPAGPGHQIGTKRFSDDFLLDGVSSRYVPNYLVGTRQGTATIMLKAFSFTDDSKPAYVLDFFFENSGGQPEPNAQYNSMATNLNVVIGEGNVGAVGIRLRGAQGSGLEDVTVDAGPGLAGVVGGCGSGGAHHGLRVLGGRYGLDLRQSQPTGTVSGTTLEGQRCAAIVYAGFESLSAVGINMTNQHGCYGVISTDNADSTFDVVGARPGACTLPMMPTGPGFPSDYQQTNPHIAGKMSFIDSTLDFSVDAAHCGRLAPSGRAAFLAVRSLFLQNVWISGTPNVYIINGSSTDSSDPTGSSSEPCGAPELMMRGQCHVEKLVYGVDPPEDRGWQLHAAVYIDGVRQRSQKVLRIGNWPSPVPKTLISKHRWSIHRNPPSFESPKCVNAKHIGAQGDGWSDDYDVIQNALDTNECVYLPRGLYLTSRTLQVRAGCALVGVARHLTRITSMDVGLLGPPRHRNHLRDSEAKVLPVVEVLPTDRANKTAAARTTTLAFLSISVWNHLDSTSALHFHADHGIYRQLHANRANRCGGLYRPGCKDAVEINYPLQVVSGAKQLKMFTFYDEDCCHKHTTSVSTGAPGVPAYWSGFLAGPQGPKCESQRHEYIWDSCALIEMIMVCDH